MIEPAARLQCRSGCVGRAVPLPAALLAKLTRIMHPLPLHALLTRRHFKDE